MCSDGGVVSQRARARNESDRSDDGDITRRQRESHRRKDRRTTNERERDRGSEKRHMCERERLIVACVFCVRVAERASERASERMNARRRYYPFRERYSRAFGSHLSHICSVTSADRVAGQPRFSGASFHSEKVKTSNGRIKKTFFRVTHRRERVKGSEKEEREKHSFVGAKLTQKKGASYRCVQCTYTLVEGCLHRTSGIARIPNH